MAQTRYFFDSPKQDPRPAAADPIAAINQSQLEHPLSFVRWLPPVSTKFWTRFADGDSNYDRLGRSESARIKQAQSKQTLEIKKKKADDSTRGSIPAVAYLGLPSVCPRWQVAEVGSDWP